MDILSSASALQRYKVRHGMRISTGCVVSSYIATCKIRRALNEDFDKAAYKDYARRRETTMKMDRAVSWMLNRLDRLPVRTIKIIHATLEESGVVAAAEELSKPMAKLMRHDYHSTLE